MSKASEIRRSKSAKDSKNEKTKANAVRRRATKRAIKLANTGQTKSDIGKSGRKIAGRKKCQKKRKQEYPMYRSCMMKFFVNEVFERIGQEAPHLKLCKKTNKETSAKLKKAVRLLWIDEMDKSSHRIGTKMATVDSIKE